MSIKIISSVFLILIAIIVSASVSLAFFSDVETSTTTSISTKSWNNLVINEVYFNLAEGHGREGKNEWIELYNRGDEPINLRGYAFESTVGNFPITTNAVLIPAKGFALISHNAQTWKIWDISKETPTVNLPGNYARDGWLLASGECLYLKDGSAKIVDSVCWDDTVPVGFSYSRISPGSFKGWQVQTPTPGL